MTLKQIGIACSVFFITTFCIAFQFQSDEIEKSHFDLHPDLMSVLVLHNAHDDSANTTIHKFKYNHSFLVLRKKNQLQFIHSITELAPYDEDHDFVIDQNDEIYDRLFVARYDQKDKKFKYMPLANTAIRGIKLIPDLHKHQLTHAEVLLTTQHQFTPNYKLVISPQLFKDSALDRMDPLHPKT